MTAALDGGTASVLCQYDRDRFDPVTLASVSAFHTRQVAAATYYADAVLRICRQYAPPGIRIAVAAEAGQRPQADATKWPGGELGMVWGPEPLVPPPKPGIAALTFLLVEVAERFRGGVRSAHAVHAGAGRRRR